MSVQDEVSFDDDCGGIVTLKPAYAFGTGYAFLRIDLGGGGFSQTVVYMEDLIAAADQLKREYL